MSDRRSSCESSFVGSLPKRWRFVVRQLLLLFIVAIIACQSIPCGFEFSAKRGNHQSTIQSNLGMATTSAIEEAVTPGESLLDFTTPVLGGLVARVLDTRRLGIDQDATNRVNASRTRCATLQRMNVRLQI
ncbi:hypothetical protein [Novipirellula aureliae]|nr:hypothetical protein [Novipirellula aureliae]